ncbi:MAG: segregation and condensation protein A, partial [Planctomycetota bacterium]
DARQDLVRRLLEYKRYRDAASVLEERSRAWQQRFARQAPDLPPRERNLADEPIAEVEVWDLVSAFGRIIRETEAGRVSSIVYDDTPIHVYMSSIYRRLVERGQLSFRDLFEPEMHKSTLVSIFLAVLELVRHHHVRVEQNQLFGEIWLLPGATTSELPDFAAVEDYDHRSAAGQAQ